MLEKLGYEVTALAGRVTLGSTHLRPTTHTLLRVRPPGQSRDEPGWLSDVGFGAGPLEPLPFADGEEVVQDGGWAFRLQRGRTIRTWSPHTVGWELHQRGGDGWVQRHVFAMNEMLRIDFDVLNYYVSTNPRSPFTARPFTQKFTPDTLHVLDGTTLTVSRPHGPSETRDLSRRSCRTCWPRTSRSSWTRTRRTASSSSSAAPGRVELSRVSPPSTLTRRMIMAETAENVVDLLLAQHDRVMLASTVENSSGKTRKDAFDQLRELLAVHETAEEEVVHPFARRAIGDDTHVVDDRLEEENEAKGVLSELEKMDTDSPPSWRSSPSSTRTSRRTPRTRRRRSSRASGRTPRASRCAACQGRARRRGGRAAPAPGDRVARQEPRGRPDRRRRRPRPRRHRQDPQLTSTGRPRLRGRARRKR